MGLDADRGGAVHRAAVTSAGRAGGQWRAARDAGGMYAADGGRDGAGVVRQARSVLDAVRAGLRRPRDHRLRDRHGLLQRHAAGGDDARSSGARLGACLGARLCGRACVSGRRAGAADPAQPGAVRPRSRRERACARHRAAGRRLDAGLRLAGAGLRARPAGRAPAGGTGDRGVPRGYQAPDPWAAAAPAHAALPGCAAVLHGWAEHAVRLRRDLRGGRAWHGDGADPAVRHRAERDGGAGRGGVRAYR